MKKSIIKKQLLLLLLVLAAFQVNSQVSDEVYYQRLFFLCKAWGHAKYYHTRIAAGLVNWDDELLTAAAGAKSAPTDAAFNDVLLQMLNNAGVMGTSNANLPVVPDSLNNNNDLNWIQDPFFSEPVRAILVDIKNKFRPQTNVYVGPGVAPVFTGDSLYYNREDYPSVEKRMLAMFRYWNQVLYFFPYYKIMDQDWDATLVEFIPDIAQATDALSFNLAFREFTSRINDTHGFYYSPVYYNWRGLFYPPFLVRYIDNEMVITKVLPDVTGVAVGDVIKEIDGVNIYDLRASLRKYSYGSNNVSIEKNLNDLITWGNYGSFEITVENNSGTITTSLTRNSENFSNLNIDNSPIWRQTVINGSCTYGIVDMGRLEVADVAGMFADLWNTDAIIFDIRNYPNETLWTIVNYLFPAPIHIANFTRCDVTYPGTFTWMYTTIGSGTTNPYTGKVIILFDERTISQAEYTCMGLGQFPGAIKIGSTTEAADGNTTRTYLTGKIYTYFTGLGTYYPDYSPTQRLGIIPDYEVHPTIDGIRAGNDEVLAFALNCSLLESDYCTSSGCNSSTEWIQKIVFGTYQNNSGSDIGYGDFTGTPIEVESGQTYNLGVTPGFSGRSRTEWCRVWIDYNSDGDFTDAGEQVFAANRLKVTVSGNVTLPTGISGEKRMRVSLKYNAIPTPCENFAYGEVEDYTLNILAPQPPVADFSGGPTAISPGASVQFTDLSSNNPTSWSWTFEGGNPSASTEQNPLVTYNSAGNFDVTLMVSNSAGSNTLNVPDYINVTQSGGCSDNYEPNETMGTAAAIAVNTDITALISPANDLDWFAFSTTNSAKNVKVTLTNLPANFDIVLYKSNGSQLGISQNTGTTSETIIYGTNKPGSYYVKVYGAGGAYDPINCYTLHVATSSTPYTKSGLAESQIEEAGDYLNVYPNPSGSSFNFIYNTDSREPITLQLFDISGRMVQEIQSFPPNELITAGANLEYGVYLAVVTQGAVKKYVKIAKVQ
jgi:PKD repeat protein